MGDPARHIELLGPDFSIFSDAERQLLLLSPPSVAESEVPLVAEQPALTLREIELQKLPTEPIEDFYLRAEYLKVELQAHPEDFLDRARELSASRSRFRSGLLSPLTLNQFEPEIRQVVYKLKEGEVSSPIVVGDSIFLYRRES